MIVCWYIRDWTEYKLNTLPTGSYSYGLLLGLELPWALRQLMHWTLPEIWAHGWWPQPLDMGQRFGRSEINIGSGVHVRFRIFRLLRVLLKSWAMKTWLIPTPTPIIPSNFSPFYLGKQGVATCSGGLFGCCVYDLLVSRFFYPLTSIPCLLLIDQPTAPS